MLKTYVRDVTPQMLQKIFDTLGHTPSARRHLIIFTKSVFAYAQKLGLIDKSPVASFSLRKPIPRERVLTESELKDLWHSSASETLTTMLRLMILTGQRRGEIQHLTLDGDIAHLKAEHSKNKKSHLFPVGPLAIELLTHDRKYTNWHGGKPSLAPGMPHWTYHDLRRTFATIHAQIGTPPYIIERTLNHTAGSLSPIALTYNRFKYMDEMREAMHKYEAHILKIVEQ